MSSKLPRLATSRYVEPDAYIGQIFRPTAGVQLSNVRYPCIIGKGDRLFQMQNMSIRRSFVYNEELLFDTVTYRASLDHNSDGRQDGAVRLVTGKGIEINYGKWQFVDLNSDGKADAIEISPEVFDQNEAYYLDYQSVDRDVLDPLPFDEIRQIKYVSLAQDNDQYGEYKDFYLPVTFGKNVIVWGDPAQPTVTNNTTQVIDVDGNRLVAGQSTYAGKYNRSYHFTCLSVSGSDYTIAWRAENDQYGNSAMPSTPVDSASTDTWPKVIITPTANQVTIDGILTVTFDTANISESDTFDVIAYAVPLIEEDERYYNPSLFATATPIYQGNLDDMSLGNWGTVVDSEDMVVSDISNYAAGTSLRNRRVQFRCTAKSTESGSESLTFWFSRIGVEGSVMTQLVFNMTTGSDTQTFDGAEITISDLAIADVGDVFIYELKAPKIFCHAKDDRSYKFSATAIGEDSVSLFYASNTSEGGFGNVNNGNPVLGAVDDGQFIVPGNVVFHARNLSTGDNINRWTMGDVIRFGNFSDEPGIVCKDVIDWSLTKKKAGEKQDVILDQNGSVTGDPGTYYIILDNIPTDADSIYMNEVAVTNFTLVEEGKPYVKFNVRPVGVDSNPIAEVTVSYEYAGAEPVPGQIYYITSNVVRPDSMYDTPILLLTPEQGRALLAPSTVENDLFIGNEIMWETNPPGIYIIQVKDTDGDGVYTKNDYERAIDASIQKKDITDKIVLNRVLDTLPKLLAVNVIDNDPFVKREEFIWVGPETGMPIGDEDTEGSIIYTGRKTLQVYGQSPAHGTRIMHGHSACTKTITLDNGTVATVNLDGSFIAAYLAAKNASFSDPSETLLKKTITAFDSIETYNDQQNLLLGAASIIFFRKIGEGVYRIEEDVTVDTFNQNTHLINCMNQYQMVVKIVRTEMANNLISLVPPDVETGVGLVKAQLVGTLRSLLSRGLIANYQNEDGTVRDFDINADVVVEVDEADRTLYHFWFAFWTRKPIKRLFGLLSIDSNNFSLV